MINTKSDNSVGELLDVLMSTPHWTDAVFRICNVHFSFASYKKTLENFHFINSQKISPFLLMHYFHTPDKQ